MNPDPTALGPAPTPQFGKIAILISGGLDSAILLGEVLRFYAAVHPIYIRNGMTWESVELDYLRRFLDAVRRPPLRPLELLDLPVADLLPGHWSTTGEGVPDANTSDDAVFVPARNVLLLAKAMVWCHLHSVPDLALATLKDNPFPDATPGFFVTFQDAVNRAVRGNVQLRRPYGRLAKPEVMRRARGLPLELTFSCIRPTSGRHCGECNKCAERRRAFADSGLADQTDYASGLIE